MLIAHSDNGWHGGIGGLKSVSTSIHQPDNLPKLNWGNKGPPCPFYRIAEFPDMPQVPSYLRIEEPVAILAVFLGILATLFFVASRPPGAKFFQVVPLLIFAYFVPTLFSNMGIIPLKSPIYAVEGKRGQVSFLRSTLRAVPAKWTCPLFPPISFSSDMHTLFVSCRRH